MTAVCERAPIFAGPVSGALLYRRARARAAHGAVLLASRGSSRRVVVPWWSCECMPEATRTEASPAVVEGRGSQVLALAAEADCFASVQRRLPGTDAAAGELVVGRATETRDGSGRRMKDFHYISLS